MTAIDPAEVIAELEAEVGCHRESCREALAERDLARRVAIRFEQENAALRILIRAYGEGRGSDLDLPGEAIFAFGETGSLSDEALALAQRLGEQS